ncbi:hypothetical protein DFS34DRAFT_99951, partial [Phlyctochytrium arcticum]
HHLYRGRSNLAHSLYKCPSTIIPHQRHCPADEQRPPIGLIGLRGVIHSLCRFQQEIVSSDFSSSVLNTFIAIVGSTSETSKDDRCKHHQNDTTARPLNQKKELAEMDATIAQMRPALRHWAIHDQESFPLSILILVEPVKQIHWIRHLLHGWFTQSKTSNIPSDQQTEAHSVPLTVRDSIWKRFARCLSAFPDIVQQPHKSQNTVSASFASHQVQALPRQPAIMG